MSEDINESNSSALPQVTEYDVSRLISVNDTSALQFSNGDRVEMPLAKFRAILSIYELSPVAQRKIPNTRGRGLHLFERKEVERALNHYMNFFNR